MRIPPPIQGFYRMPPEQYRAVDAVNFSWLKLGLCGVEYMLAPRPEPSESRALIVGQALHCLLLETDEYASRFAVAPELDRRTKAGKEAAAIFEAENAGKSVLTADESARVGKMAASVRAHSKAAVLVASKGERELSAFWKDAVTGLMLKCRFDLVVPGSIGTLVDIKTTQAAHTEAFQRSIQQYAYDVQSAIYHDGYRAITGRQLDHTIIAVESDEPHVCRVYRIDDESVQVGRVKYRRVLHEYAAAVRGESRPAQDVESIGLPTWELRKYGSGGME